MTMIAAIAAMDAQRAIGFENRLPWRIPEDLKRFSALTVGHTVLMGRKTYDSLPPKFRPLPNRTNVVASRSLAASDLPPEVELSGSLDSYLEDVCSGRRRLASDRLWIAGGAEIYAETRHCWDKVFLTVVHSTFRGDAFFPEFEADFELISEEAGTDPDTPCSYRVYARRGSKDSRPKVKGC